MIDARIHHDPTRAPDLITRAIKAADTQRELAARIGVTPRYLQLLARGQREMSYPVQVVLEQISASTAKRRE